jgi:hypothetical protein
MRGLLKSATNDHARTPLPAALDVRERCPIIENIRIRGDERISADIKSLCPLAYEVLYDPGDISNSGEWGTSSVFNGEG